MKHKLPVESVLDGKGIPYALIPMREAAYTVEDVIRHSETPVKREEICKTIILKGKKTGAMRAIFLRGGDRIDFSKAKKQFSEEMTIASPEDVMRASGVEPGAVCPFLLSVPLVVDEAVRRLARVNCGSGDHLVGLEFAFEDLARGIRYEVADLARLV